ncbi:MAG: hypothetical protein R3F05_20615 [Planctomycetota bacterium]
MDSDVHVVPVPAAGVLVLMADPEIDFDVEIIAVSAESVCGGPLPLVRPPVFPAVERRAFDPPAPLLATLATVPAGWRGATEVVVPPNAKLVVIGASDSTMVYEQVLPLGSGERRSCELRVRAAARLQFVLAGSESGATVVLGETGAPTKERPSLPAIACQIPGPKRAAVLSGVPVPFSGSARVQQGLRSWLADVVVDSTGVHRVSVDAPPRADSEQTVQLQVNDLGGLPVPGAVVNWIGPGAARIRSVADNKGLAIGDLDVASLVAVHVWADGFVPKHVAPNAIIGPVQLVRGGTLVVDVGETLGGLLVRIDLAQAGRRLRRATAGLSQAGGTTQFTGLAAGTYRIDLAVRDDDGEWHAQGGQDVVLGPGDVVRAQLP